VWAAGAALGQTIFDAGRTRAVVSGARAGYDQSLAEYRHTVLAAFQDVEDELAATRILAREANAQDDAIAAARGALDRTLNQYRAGTVSHLAVFVAQATLLNAERAGVDLTGRRQLAAVALYKATGGGWTLTRP
jgi:outer membrane protein TolC